MTSVPITKETVSRLLRDVKSIMRNPLTENGIYYIHDDERMLKGYALIIGPEDTPYFGGYYFFDITFPSDYPHSPPHVVFCTNGDNIRFNPNLYTNGKVCVSMLNTWRGEQWTSCQTISSLLLTLCTLLTKEPFLNEPGVSSTHPDFPKYHQIIEYKNIDVAILKMIHQSVGVYPRQFDVFYPTLVDLFLKNYDALSQFVTIKAIAEVTPLRLTTAMFGMDVTLNYAQLMVKLSETQEALIARSLKTIV